MQQARTSRHVRWVSLWALFGIVSAISLFGPSVTLATERWQQSTLKSVYPQGNGDFVIIFSTESQGYCTSTATPKYYHVAVGQYSVNAEGAKRMYAAALLSLASDLPILIAFDDATSFCYVNRLLIEK